MSIYITAIRTDGMNLAFNVHAKPIHVTIVSSNVLEAAHVFFIMTGTTKYKSVTMSTELQIVDINKYDSDTMLADEFLLGEM